MVKKKYDVFVIGSGVAGQTAAEICVKKNLIVAISDIREFGGTCSNRGCDPKKILLQFSDLLAYTNQLKNLGVEQLPEINWNQVQKFKEKLIGSIPERTKTKLDNLKIDSYCGSAKFMNDHTLRINETEIVADYFVIASGKIPRTLEIEGAEFLKTSEDVLNLKDIPKTTAFIGGGYIGMEFACMLANLGSKVTIFQKGDTVLSQFDPYIVDTLLEYLKTIGIEIIYNSDVTKIEKNNTSLNVHYAIGAKELNSNFDFVVNSSGRVPALDSLNLDNASVKHDAKGVQVNDYMQSVSNKRVYACGDVSDKSLPLTPLSGLQGHIVGHNILKSQSKVFEYPLVPSTVFTYPNLATAGVSEAEAKNTYKNIDIFKGDLSGTFNGKKQNISVYAYKLIVDKDTEKVIGAHLLGPNVNENINLLSIIIEKNMTVTEVKKMIFSYPSYSNDIKGMFKNR